MTRMVKEKIANDSELPPKSTAAFLTLHKLARHPSPLPAGDKPYGHPLGHTLWRQPGIQLKG